MGLLLDGFEKLINEHGSAAILKERIILANDKYSALEKKHAESEVRIKNLEAEKEALRLDNSKYREQVRNLEEQLVKLIHNPILLFDDKAGTWSEEGKATRYCPKCKASSMLSPMRNERNGLFCSVCSTSCGDPDRRVEGPINIEW